MHSCGVNFLGKGLLFVGHSGAGKSTMATFLQGKAQILCDDRVILRKAEDGFKIFGTWSHGDVTEISADSAPLEAILFLKKSAQNRMIPIVSKSEATKRLLSCLVKPFTTVDWWDKTVSLIEKIPLRVPCYILEFDKSGKITDILKEL